MSATKPELTAEQQAKLDLIYENLAEVIDGQIIEEILSKNEPLRIYLGTATTGRPHCGYFVPFMKIAQFLQAGCHVKILLADLHAVLDHLKSTFELVEQRAKYYRFCITSLLKALNVPVDKLEFVLGSSYQLTPAYSMDVYRLASMVSEHDAKKAGAEVVKQSENAPLSGLLYPLLQALDEQYLDVDVQFGGVDQRKIFMLAKEQLPRVGYKVRAHLCSKMVPGLAGGKMSASDPNSKIDLLDTPEVVTRKIKKANAPPKEVEGNGLISFVEFVILPASALLDGNRHFDVEINGEKKVYTDIDTLKEDYKNDILTPQSLKPAITAVLNKMLEPIQKEFQASSEWQEVEKKAYPPVVEEKKQKKQKKDKGSRYPGAAKQAEVGKDPAAAGTEDVAKSAEEAMEKLNVK